MVWNFLKSKFFKKTRDEAVKEKIKTEISKPEDFLDKAPATPPVLEKLPVSAVKEKPHSEKTDDELAEELNKISPEILSQAKTPQMRKTVIDVYRKMLIDGVDVNDDKAVKKWLKKHPEAMQGGEIRKIDTFKRESPKVGRNDPCPCGSGKKYKKCCGVVKR